MSDGESNLKYGDDGRTLTFRPRWDSVSKRKWNHMGHSSLERSSGNFTSWTGPIVLGTLTPPSSRCPTSPSSLPSTRSGTWTGWPNPSAREWSSLRDAAHPSSISPSPGYFGGEIDQKHDTLRNLGLNLPPRYEDEMPCMKLYKPAECYAAVSFTLSLTICHPLSSFILSPFIEVHIVRLYRDSHCHPFYWVSHCHPLSRFKIASGGRGGVGGSSWGQLLRRRWLGEWWWWGCLGRWWRGLEKEEEVQRGGGSLWEMDKGDARGKDYGESNCRLQSAAQVERGASILQRCVNFQEPALDLPSADLRTMDHDANTYEKVVLNYHSSSNIPCSHRVALWTASATGVCSETGMWRCGSPRRSTMAWATCPRKGWWRSLTRRRHLTGGFLAALVTRLGAKTPPHFPLSGPETWLTTSSLPLCAAGSSND